MVYDGVGAIVITSILVGAWMDGRRYGAILQLFPFTLCDVIITFPRVPSKKKKKNEPGRWKTTPNLTRS